MHMLSRTAVIKVSGSSFSLLTEAHTAVSDFLMGKGIQGHTVAVWSETLLLSNTDDYEIAALSNTHECKKSCPHS